MASGIGLEKRVVSIPIGGTVVFVRARRAARGGRCRASRWPEGDKKFSEKSRLGAFQLSSARAQTRPLIAIDLGDYAASIAAEALLEKPVATGLEGKADGVREAVRRLSLCDAG